MFVIEFIILYYIDMDTPVVVYYWYQRVLKMYIMTNQSLYCIFCGSDHCASTTVLVVFIIMFP